VIEPFYYDYWGNRIETSEPTRRALLDAIGEEDQSAAAVVVREGDAPAIAGEYDGWAIELEGGESYGGELSRLPLGYHRLTTRRCDDEQTRALIVTPHRCYLPGAMRDGGCWAVSTQLYALRSKRNWGIGDFGDLAAFARLSAGAGARSIGLNPLHELHPCNPTAASPYSPSSRLFLNVLYIDVEGVPEFRESPQAKAAVAAPEFRQRLDGLRRTELVDYAGVAAAKLEILAMLHRTFHVEHLRRNDARARAFVRFRREGGQTLARLARYEALAEHFRALDASSYGWQDWPAEYQSPESAAVARFARVHAERVRFFCYLQWVATEQLAAAASAAAASGATLYGDLAVGSALGGADAWSGRQALVVDASLGAPPDPLNRLGQNWGVAPLSPRALRTLGYAPLVALLRSNMRHAGILRIDHVMALRRAFLIPRGAPASLGAYVRYPLEEMLGIVALESVRNRCAVVGEDLGTVPEGFRERMTDARVLSTRIFYFERDWSDATFLPPERWPRMAAASFGTHDLPTLLGWWTGDRGEAEDRTADRLRLVEALEGAGALGAADAGALREDARRGGTPHVAAQLAAGMQRFLAATPSVLHVAAIEDVLYETQAVNVPGTLDEHPNWRRKRSLSLEEMERDGRLAQAAAILNR